MKIHLFHQYNTFQNVLLLHIISYSDKKICPMAKRFSVTNNSLIKEKKIDKNSAEAEDIFSGEFIKPWLWYITCLTNRVRQLNYSWNSLKQDKRNYSFCLIMFNISAKQFKISIKRLQGSRIHLKTSNIQLGNGNLLLVD